MSRPEELNFFILRAGLGAGGRVVREPLPRRRAFAARPPPTTPADHASKGVTERMRSSAWGRSVWVYMVRNPIDRMLSHYLHNVGGGYEHRALDRRPRRPARAPT